MAEDIGADFLRGLSIASSFQDIKTKKDANKKAEEQKKEFENIISSSPDKLGSVIKSQEGLKFAKDLIDLKDYESPDQKRAKDFSYQQAQLNERARLKQFVENRKMFNEYSNDATQALVALNKIETQGKNLPVYERGFWNQVGAKADVAVKSFGKDQAMARYQGVVSQELIPMARKLMEEKGPITEWDVQRVEKGLGDATLPYEDKKFLIDELRVKVKYAVRNKLDLAGMSTEEFMQAYPNFANMLKGIYTPEEKAAALAELKKRGDLK